MARRIKTVRVQPKEIKLEIDYDKLANAIVKAQQKSIVQEPSHSKMRSKLMRFLNGGIYISLSLFCFYGIFHLWHNYYNKTNHDLVLTIILTLLLGAFEIVFYLCQQESLTESKRESADHFNTNLSWIALIVAMIALFYEKL